MEIERRDCEMAERKTNEERLQELSDKKAQLDKKKELLNTQIKSIESRISKQERAARTRRLIQNGALAEKFFDCEGIEPNEFENLLKRLVEIDQVKAIIKNEE